MPQVVIVDEIGTEAEALACRTIAERGVTLVGTAHGQLLENLIKNPTLSDLVGGVQTVTLGDDEARARGCQKTIMERQAPPTFPILIEMHERNFWVAHNVEESVDETLAGGRPVVQMRRRDEATGHVTMDRCVYDAEVAAQRESLSFTLGSMGGVMAPTASMDSGMFDKAQKETRGNAEETKAANAISFSPAAQSNNAVHRVTPQPSMSSSPRRSIGFGRYLRRTERRRASRASRDSFPSGCLYSSMYLMMQSMTGCGRSSQRPSRSSASRTCSTVSAAGGGGLGAGAGAAIIARSRGSFGANRAAGPLPRFGHPLR